MARANGSAADRVKAVRPARGPEQIYERIKGMAITFAIRPGQRVNEVELSKALNVSRTPLREALNRLMVEGFLTRAPNKGFSGRLLDAKQIFDLYELRRALETSMVRIACERATAEELVELERFVKSSIARRAAADTGSLLALDEQFHERLSALTHNLEMINLLKAINARIHFVRWLDMQRHYSQQDHLRIVKALKARDADKAATLVESHITRRLDQIVEVIRLGFAEIYMRDQAGAAK
jgi:DNA-binding GntR family transcriptional regulator